MPLCPLVLIRIMIFTIHIINIVLTYLDICSFTQFLSFQTVNLLVAICVMIGILIGVVLPLTLYDINPEIVSIINPIPIGPPPHQNMQIGLLLGMFQIRCQKLQFLVSSSIKNIANKLDIFHAKISTAFEDSSNYRLSRKCLSSFLNDYGRRSCYSAGDDSARLR